MTSHYVLTLNPTNPSSYGQKGLVDPLNHDRPELVDLVAEAIAHLPGKHLVKVTIQVEIIASQPIEPAHNTMPVPDLSWAEENLLSTGIGKDVSESNTNGFAITEAIGY